MSASKIVPFLFEGEGLIRVVELNSHAWFVAADVCRALEVKNTTQALQALDEDEKGLCSTYTPGGLQDLLTVSEGGLYTLILRSRQATTPGTVQHRFRKWVTGEVLPAIRKTGHYAGAAPAEDDDAGLVEPEDMRLKKVNTAIRAFGARAGAQLWVKLGLDWVPAMAAALAQSDLLDATNPPSGGNGGTH